MLGIVCLPWRDDLGARMCPLDEEGTTEPGILTPEMRSDSGLQSSGMLDHGKSLELAFSGASAWGGVP